MLCNNPQQRRLLYGQPRNSRSRTYKDKKLIHSRKGTIRLWRTNTLFSMTILGFLFENKSAGAWCCWLNPPLSLRMFGAILQIPYIILWLSQGTFYLNFPVLIHHLWWLRSGKLGRLEFVFDEYKILREEGTSLLRRCFCCLQNVC